MDEVTLNLLHILKRIIMSGFHVAFNVQIQPDLRELMETMNRMSNMPPDSEAKDKVSLWFVTLCHPVYSVYVVAPRISPVQELHLRLDSVADIVCKQLNFSVNYTFSEC